MNLDDSAFFSCFHWLVCKKTTIQLSVCMSVSSPSKVVPVAFQIHANMRHDQKIMITIPNFCERVFHVRF